MTLSSLIPLSTLFLAIMTSSFVSEDETNHGKIKEELADNSFIITDLTFSLKSSDFPKSKKEEVTYSYPYSASSYLVDTHFELIPEDTLTRIENKDTTTSNPIVITREDILIIPETVLSSACRCISTTHLITIDSIPQLLNTDSVQQHIREKQSSSNNHSVMFQPSVYPNPISSFGELQLIMQEDQLIEITLYDISGKRIANYYSGILEKGRHSFQIDLSHLPIALYLLKVADNSQTETIKIQKT